MKFFTNVILFYFLFTQICLAQKQKELLFQADSLVRINRLDDASGVFFKILDEDPKCLSCLAGLADIKSTEKDFTGALNFLNRAIEINDKYALAYYKRGILNLMSGVLDDFESDLNKAIALDSENPEFYFGRGNYFLSKNALNLALKDFRKLNQLAPQNPIPLFSIAKVYINKKDWDNALTYVNKSIELDSSRYDFYSYKAGVLAEKGQIKEALLFYNKSIELDSTIWQTYLNRQEIWYELENMDRSCDDVRKVIALLNGVKEESEICVQLEAKNKLLCDPSNSAYYYQRGIASFNLEKYEKAVNFYDRGLVKFPSSAMIRSFRANALMLLNEYERALSDFQYVLKNRLILKKEAIVEFELKDKEMDGDSYLAGVLSENFANMAKAHLSLGQYDKVFVFCDSSEIMIKEKDLLKIPDFKRITANLSNYRGIAAMNTGDFKKAQRYFETALSLDSKILSAYYNIALLMVITEEQKLEKTRRWAFSLSNDATVPINLVFSKIKKDEIDTNNISQALALLNSIIKEEKNAEFYLLRGYVKVLLEMPDACLDFETAKNLNLIGAENFIKEFCS